VQPAELFDFDLHLFDLSERSITCFLDSFTQLAREGLGAQRSRVDLTTVSQLDAGGNVASTIVSSSLRALQNVPPLEISLDRPTLVINRVCIRFLTPTELKSGEQLASQPEFPILAARIRARVSTLR